MLIVSGILYCLFADSTLQSWNSPESKTDVEMEYLNKKSNSNENVLKNNKINEADKNSNELKKNEALNGIAPLAVPMLLIEEVADRISDDSDEEK